MPAAQPKHEDEPGAFWYCPHWQPRPDVVILMGLSADPTVCEMLIEYVPTPPVVPAENNWTTVSGADDTPVPVITERRKREPEVTAVTVSIWSKMYPVNLAIPVPEGQ